jgi:Single-strand binding protein family
MARPDNPRLYIDPEHIAHTLNAQHKPIKDRALGDGIEFASSDHDTVLAVFTDAGIARVRRGRAKHDLPVVAARVPEEEDAVSFPQAELGSGMIVRADGSFDIIHSPMSAAEKPQETSKRPERPIGQHQLQATGSEPSAAPEEHSGNGSKILYLNSQEAGARTGLEQAQPAQEQPEQRGRHEKDQRIRCTGNLGYTPKTRETKTGPVLRFAIAEHPEKGQTLWHTVVATRDVAKGLNERELQKGQEVTITGYRKTGTRNNKATGEPERFDYVLAVGVTGTDAQGKAWAVWLPKPSPRPQA